MDIGAAIVFTLELALVVCIWIMYQRARTDLNAKAAQLPVLTELKSLQSAIAEQIESLKRESARANSELDLRCMRANSLLEGLEKALDQFDARTALPVANEVQKQLAPREAVVHLASVGYSSEEISAQTGVPKGEVELIVGLEQQRTTGQ